MSGYVSRLSLPWDRDRDRCSTCGCQRLSQRRPAAAEGATPLRPAPLCQADVAAAVCCKVAAVCGSGVDSWTAMACRACAVAVV